MDVKENHSGLSIDNAPGIKLNRMSCPYRFSIIPARFRNI